jgi:hypothetical protein
MLSLDEEVVTVCCEDVTFHMHDPLAHKRVRVVQSMLRWPRTFIGDSLNSRVKQLQRIRVVIQHDSLAVVAKENE